jgi:hypothetical protein
MEGNGSGGEGFIAGGELQSIELCSIPGFDSITGRSCILLDEHEGRCKVDTPLLDSDEWGQPQWRDYEAVFGRHVTPSE